MPGTPRKNSRTNSAAAPASDPAPPAAERIDILEILRTEDLEPVPITFRGVDTEIRRSYTGEEAVEFLALVGDRKFPEVLDLIAPGSGIALWEKIGPLAPEHAAKILNRFFELSTLHEGELLAPLPASFTKVAGARPTPDSGATTS